MSSLRVRGDVLKNSNKTFSRKRAFSNKRAFSLIELIFIIAVLAIIAAVAVPKLMDSKSNALVTSIKQDITTITNSIQSYHMLNNSIDKISDVVTLDTNRWEVKDKKVLYKVDTKPCVTIEITGAKLNVTVDTSSSEICKKISDHGIINQTLELF